MIHTPNHSGKTDPVMRRAFKQRRFAFRSGRCCAQISPHWTLMRQNCLKKANLSLKVPFQPLKLDWVSFPLLSDYRGRGRSTSAVPPTQPMDARGQTPTFLLSHGLAFRALVSHPKRHKENSFTSISLDALDPKRIELNQSKDKEELSLLIF